MAAKQGGERAEGRMGTKGEAANAGGERGRESGKEDEEMTGKAKSGPECIVGWSITIIMVEQEEDEDDEELDGAEEGDSISAIGEIESSNFIN